MQPEAGGVPVLVQLDARNHDIAGVDTNGCSRSVGLVALYPVNMNHPFLPVYLGDLALPTLVLPANDPDLVILANRQ